MFSWSASLHCLCYSPSSPQDCWLPYLRSLQPKIPLIMSSPIGSSFPMNTSKKCAMTLPTLIPMLSRNFLDCLCLTMLPIQHIWEVKFPHENQVLWFRNFLKAFKEGLVHFLSFICSVICIKIPVGCENYLSLPSLALTQTLNYMDMVPSCGSFTQVVS